MNKTTLALLFCAAISAAGGQLLFKIAAAGRVQIIEFLNIHLLLGSVLYLLGTAIWIYVLSYEKLVNVYAFTALTFVAVYLGGVFLLKERLTPVAICGVVLVLFGLFLITNSDS